VGVLEKGTAIAELLPARAGQRQEQTLRRPLLATGRKVTGPRPPALPAPQDQLRPSVVGVRAHGLWSPAGSALPACRRGTVPGLSLGTRLRGGTWRSETLFSGKSDLQRCSARLPAPGRPRDAEPPDAAPQPGCPRALRPALRDAPANCVVLLRPAGSCWF